MLMTTRAPTRLIIKRRVPRDTGNTSKGCPPPPTRALQGHLPPLRTKVMKSILLVHHPPPLNLSVSFLPQIFQYALDAFGVPGRGATTRLISDNRPFQCERTLLSETYQTFRGGRSIRQRQRWRLRIRYQRGTVMRIVNVATARKVVQDGVYLVSGCVLDNL